MKKYINQIPNGQRHSGEKIVPTPNENYDKLVFAYLHISQTLLTDLSFATNKISNNMSMRVLGPNFEDFGPKLD